jgi:UDP-glucose:tetrahydrobiopterin glucosyltransferase
MRLLFLTIPSLPYNPSKHNSIGESLHLTAESLRRSGVRCDILAAEGSDPLEGVIMVPGRLEINFGNKVETLSGIQADGVLENMLEYCRRHQDDYDFMIALGQDYLAYLLQPYFKTPFLLIPNVCESNEATDRLLVRRYLETPDRVGFLSRSQAACILGDQELPGRTVVVWAPFDVRQYDHQAEVDDRDIFWAGRIHEVKGVTEVAKACRALGKRMLLAGDISDQDYFDALIAEPGVEYLGTLDRTAMGLRMARSPVFFQLQASTWQEAFGRTTAEALLAGCPVIAFKSGANAELVEQGKDGFVVDSLDEAIAAYPEALKLDRAQIKARAQARFQPQHHTEQLLRWLERLRG